MYIHELIIAMGVGPGGRPTNNNGIKEKWHVVCCDGKINVTQDPDTARCEVLMKPFDSESDAWDCVE